MDNSVVVVLLKFGWILSVIKVKSRNTHFYEGANNSEGGET